MPGVLSTLFLLGFGQGILLSASLLLRKRNTAANKIFGILILLLSIELLVSYYVERRGFAPVFPYFMIVETFILLYGPLIYFYVAFLTVRIKKFRPGHAVHLFPFLLGIFHALGFFFEDSPRRLDIIRMYTAKQFPPDVLLVDTVPYIIVVPYMIAAFFVLRWYSKQIEDLFSEKNRKNLRWLQVLIPLILLCWICAIAALFFYYSDHTRAGIMSQISYLAMTILVYISGYFALIQPELFSPEQKEIIDTCLVNDQAVLSGREGIRKKYEKTRLDRSVIEDYMRSILEYMKKDKPFLDSEFNIRELSDDTGIPVHHLSQTINTCINNNFFYFINSFRVEEAKNALADPARSMHTILMIAFESGFNSKATFNAIFKEYTGYTPSQYRSLKIEKKKSSQPSNM